MALDDFKLYFKVIFRTLTVQNGWKFGFKDDLSDILAVNGSKKQFKLSELKKIDMP